MSQTRTEPDYDWIEFEPLSTGERLAKSMIFLASIASSLLLTWLAVETLFPG